MRRCFLYLHHMYGVSFILKPMKKSRPLHAFLLCVQRSGARNCSLSKLTFETLEVGMEQTVADDSILAEVPIIMIIQQVN